MMTKAEWIARRGKAGKFKRQVGYTNWRIDAVRSGKARQIRGLEQRWVEWGKEILNRPLPENTILL